MELLKPNLSQEGGNCNNSTPSSSSSLYIKEPGFEWSYSLPDIFGWPGSQRFQIYRELEDEGQIFFVGYSLAAAHVAGLASAGSKGGQEQTTGSP